MLFDDVVLDEIRVLVSSKISLDDIAIFYDYDSTEDFIKDLQLNINKPYQIFLQIIPPSLQALSEPRLKKVLKDIEKIRKSPERLARLLLKKITAAGLDGCPIKDIIRSSHKTEAELDTIISKNALAPDFKTFIEDCHAEYRIRLRHAMVAKGIVQGDGNALKFLSEKGLDDMKEVKSDINVNLNQDNRKVVFLPEGKSIQELLDAQEIKQIE